MKLSTKFLRDYLDLPKDITYEKVLDDVEKRDYADSHRAISPLKQAEDAIIADTSELNFEESVALIQKIIAQHLEKKADQNP